MKVHAPAMQSKNSPRLHHASREVNRSEVTSREVSLGELNARNHVVCCARARLCVCVCRVPCVPCVPCVYVYVCVVAAVVTAVVVGQ